MLISMDIRSASDFWFLSDFPEKYDMPVLSYFFAYSLGKMSNERGICSETASIFSQDNYQLIYKFFIDSETGKKVITDNTYIVIYTESDLPLDK
jgi:hypothetical protein